MARGKGSDVLSLDELLGEGSRGVLLDVVLEPGQVHGLVVGDYDRWSIVDGHSSLFGSRSVLYL